MTEHFAERAPVPAGLAALAIQLLGQPNHVTRNSRRGVVAIGWQRGRVMLAITDHLNGSATVTVTVWARHSAAESVWVSAPEGAEYTAAEMNIRRFAESVATSREARNE